MDVRPTALATGACNPSGKRTSVLAICMAILGIQVSAVVLLWLMAVLPPLVALLMAVALAIAWCIWLEKHPERLGDLDARRF